MVLSNIYEYQKKADMNKAINRMRIFTEKKFNEMISGKIRYKNSNSTILL